MDSMTYSSEGSPTTLVKQPQISHHKKDLCSVTPAAVVDPVVPASMLTWLNDDSDSEAADAAAAWGTPVSSSGVCEPAKIGSRSRDKTRETVAAAAAAAAARSTAAEGRAEQGSPPHDDGDLQRGEVVVESLRVTVSGSERDQKQEDFQPPSPGAEDCHGTAVFVDRSPHRSLDSNTRGEGYGSNMKDTRAAQTATKVVDATNDLVQITGGEEVDRPKLTSPSRAMERWLSRDSDENISARAGSGSGMRLGESIGNGAWQEEIFRWAMFCSGVQVAFTTMFSA